MPSLQYKLFSGVISRLPIKLRLQILYFRRFRRFVDFNEPKTFNEKLQVRKIFDRDESLVVCADKLKSKEFVSSIVENIYIPKTLWVGKSSNCLDELSFEQLPDDYVYKANHTSQTIEIIRDSNHLSKNKMKHLAKRWLKHDQASALGEWAYQNVPPRVFIEEFLDFDGKAPDDYKFFVYHGRVHFIQLDSNRFTDHKRNMFDRDWNDLGFDFSHKRMLPSPEKPSFIDEMIKVAELLGGKFDFIRVDLYWYQNRIAFGELTVYPGAGFEKFPSLEFDIKFGQPWKF